MISNLRISVAELVVWALLAAAGLTWVSLGVLSGFERAWDWWRDRHAAAEDDPFTLCDGCKDDSDEVCTHLNPQDCPVHAMVPCTEHGWHLASFGPCEDDLSPLPPERTWEQLTSHQLPLADQRMGPAERAFWSELDEFGPHGVLRPERERRAPWWEAEHRAAYESLGFDYPSGLMARVRELTPP